MKIGKCKRVKSRPYNALFKIYFLRFCCFYYIRERIYKVCSFVIIMYFICLVSKKLLVGLLNQLELARVLFICTSISIFPVKSVVYDKLIRYEVNFYYFRGSIIVCITSNHSRSIQSSPIFVLLKSLIQFFSQSKHMFL